MTVTRAGALESYYALPAHGMALVVQRARDVVRALDFCAAEVPRGATILAASCIVRRCPTSRSHGSCITMDHCVTHGSIDIEPP
jgi:hypothetical protein